MWQGQLTDDWVAVGEIDVAGCSGGVRLYAALDELLVWQCGRLGQAIGAAADGVCPLQQNLGWCEAACSFP